MGVQAGIRPGGTLAELAAMSLHGMLAQQRVIEERAVRAVP
jgi:hypothetical protein